MKVLHVSTPLSWRGGEQQAAYLAIALGKERVEETVLCPQHSELAGRMEAAGIPCVTFPSRGWLNVALAAKISKVCREESITLIHTHDSHAHTAAVISTAFFGNPAPIVVSRRVDFPVSNHFLSRWKYNHPTVRKIICVSEFIKTITAPAIQNKSVLTVIHSGIDLTRYDFLPEANILRTEFGWGPEVKIVGNLSALADHKDYPTFLKVAATLLQQDPSFHFIIAGTGPEESTIRQMIKELALENHVHLLGFRKDVPEIMKALDVFLITSQTEGLGTIVLEAFAAGTPVVATRAGGIPELVVEGISGLSAEPGDVAALREAVFRIFKEEALRARLVQAAQLKAKEFSFTETALRTKKIYSELTGY